MLCGVAAICSAASLSGCATLCFSALSGGTTLGSMSDLADLAFRDVTVIDGSGDEPVVADVAVTQDRIVTIGAAAGEARVDVSGAGLALAPGFIDVHTHDDLAVLVDPTHQCKTLQGVTTVVVGNCGMGPLNDRAVAGFGDETPVSWNDHAGYFAALDAEPPSCNVGVLAGHGSIRAEVMGRQENRTATPHEMAQMTVHVVEALDAGALGMSSGLAYEPGNYAPEEELAELAAPVAEAGGVYTSHIRDEGDELEAAVAEAIRVGERSGVAVQLSHHKAAGEPNWGKVAITLAMIEDARARGVDVTLDQYPYTAGSTLLEQVVRQGGLGGPSVSANRPLGVHVGENVVIAAAPERPELEGRRLSDLAAEMGMELRAAAEQIVAQAGERTFVILHSMNEADVRTVMAHPLTMIGSDGIPAGTKAHPRLWGTFPRVLGHYARDIGLFSLAEAVHRMTGAAADRFGLTQRGRLEVGAYADMVLFDPATIADVATYADPARPPLGIHGVWVNGEQIVSGQSHTGRRPGRALRR